MSPGEGILKKLLSPTMEARQGHWVEGNCPARTAELQQDRRKESEGYRGPHRHPHPSSYGSIVEAGTYSGLSHSKAESGAGWSRDPEQGVPSPGANRPGSGYRSPPLGRG